MALKGFTIYQLPAVADPTTELAGALFEVEVPTGPVAGAYTNKKVTMEQLASYLGATGGGTTPPDAVKLDPPTNLRQTGATTTSITLQWDAVPGATGYKLRRNGSVIVYSGSATTKVDTGLSAGVTPSYDVQALGNGSTTSNSDYSAPIQASTASGGTEGLSNFLVIGSDGVSNFTVTGS